MPQGFLLFHGTDNGHREDCSIFYTKREVYLDKDLLDKRVAEIKAVHARLDDSTAYVDVQPVFIDEPDPEALRQYEDDILENSKTDEERAEDRSKVMQSMSEFLETFIGDEEENQGPDTDKPLPDHLKQLRCFKCGGPIQVNDQGDMIDGYNFMGFSPCHNRCNQ